jgi:ParB family transcriptional regulator, chromosome partitioning protein
VERTLPQLDERRLEFRARTRGIKKVQASDSIGKLIDVYVRKAQEGELGALLVEAVILQSARTPAESSKTLKEAAQFYKVDTDEISKKVNAEFAAKLKAQAAKKESTKAKSKQAKKTKAA